MLLRVKSLPYSYFLLQNNTLSSCKSHQKNLSLFSTLSFCRTKVERRSYFFQICVKIITFFLATLHVAKSRDYSREDRWKSAISSRSWLSRERRSREERTRKKRERALALAVGAQHGRVKGKKRKKRYSHFSWLPTRSTWPRWKRMASPEFVVAKRWVHIFLACWENQRILAEKILSRWQ